MQLCCKHCPCQLDSTNLHQSFPYFIKFSLNQACAFPYTPLSRALGQLFLLTFHTLWPKLFHPLCLIHSHFFMPTFCFPHQAASIHLPNYFLTLPYTPFTSSPNTPLVLSVNHLSSILFYLFFPLPSQSFLSNLASSCSSCLPIPLLLQLPLPPYVLHPTHCL